MAFVYILGSACIYIYIVFIHQSVYFSFIYTHRVLHLILKRMYDFFFSIEQRRVYSLYTCWNISRNQPLAEAQICRSMNSTPASAAHSSYIPIPFSVSVLSLSHSLFVSIFRNFPLFSAAVADVGLVPPPDSLSAEGGNDRILK